MVRVFTTVGVWEYPTELEPVADKTAATIATTLDGVLRGFCATISKSLGPGEVWLLHIAIGDGISSNERAGRISPGLKNVLRGVLVHVRHIFWYIFVPDAHPTPTQYMFL